MTAATGDHQDAVPGCAQLLFPVGPCGSPRRSVAGSPLAAHSPRSGAGFRLTLRGDISELYARGIVRARKPALENDIPMPAWANGLLGGRLLLGALAFARRD